MKRTVKLDYLSSNSTSYRWLEFLEAFMLSL